MFSCILNSVPNKLSPIIVIVFCYVFMFCTDAMATGLVFPTDATCGIADVADNGRLIPRLPDYTAYQDMTLEGDELSSAAHTVGLDYAKRFAIALTAPIDANYPMHIEIEADIRTELDNDGDTLLYLTDRNQMVGVELLDNNNTPARAGAVGVTANWNNNQLFVDNFSRIGAVNVNPNRVNLLPTFRTYRINMVLDSATSSRLQLSVYENGALLQRSAIVNSNVQLDPSNGLWFTQVTSTNDPLEQSHRFGRFSMKISDNNGCDFGDAPDPIPGAGVNNYETLDRNNGPSHTISTDIYLGARAPDTDTDGFHDGAETLGDASADDTKGASNDDEDGIASPIFMNNNMMQMHEITCNDFNDVLGDQQAFVYGWIDANRNGVFELDEAAEAECDDFTPFNDGNAILIWPALNLQAGSSIMRLRITNSPLDIDFNNNIDERAYGVTNRGEVEDHLVEIDNLISGYVFHDNGANGGTSSNGNKENNELGLANIEVTLYDSTANMCTTVTSSDGTTDANHDGMINQLDLGYYQFIAEIGHEYQLYETDDIAIPVNCAVGPPQMGTIARESGTVIGKQISDATGFMSTTANVINIGALRNTITRQNFGDLAYNNPFPVCDVNGYSAKGNPTQLFYVNSEVDIETAIGQVSDTYYASIGYSVRQNLIFGVDRNNNDIVVINAVGVVVTRFTLPELNGVVGIISGEVTDDDKLLFGTSERGAEQIHVIDINPASANYLNYIGVSSVLNIHFADIAIHPLDGSIWTIDFDNPNRLFRIDLNLNSMVATLTHIANLDVITGNGPGGLFFDSEGYMYASINNTGNTFRFDLTDPTNPAINGGIVATGAASTSYDGARCRYAALNLSPTVSGYVYHDNGNGSGIEANGIKEVNEPGLANVLVTLYNSTDNQCTSIETSDGSADANGDGVIDLFDRGYYEFDVDFGDSYQVFETAAATAPLNCAAGPPSRGSIDPATGALNNNQIGDNENFISTTANVIDIGEISTSFTQQNFGDLEYSDGFDVCDANAYLAKNNPTQLFSVNLVTMAENELGTATPDRYNAIGYSSRQNLLFGIEGPTRDVIALNAANQVIARFDIPELNDHFFFSGDVTDDDILVLISGGRSGRMIYLVNIDPTSTEYMSYIAHSAPTNQVQGDIAVHPVDGSIWSIGWDAPDELIRFNINIETAATTITNYGDTNITTGNGPGALYFDNLGFLYASVNTTGDTYRFDITNTDNPVVNGALIAAGPAAFGNDGARCRYAAVPLDFGDADNSYSSLMANNGPRHQTTQLLPFLGDTRPDNENDATTNAEATGDDTTGLAPDDEDGMVQPTIRQILAGGDTLTIDVTVNSSGDDNLYGWIDFNGDGRFDDETEEATSAVSADGVTALDFVVTDDVSIGMTAVRLRICSSMASCDSPVGPSNNGEVEDHMINLAPEGDLALTLSLEPSINVTTGIPFNVVVALTNNSEVVAENTVINFPIPEGYTFVRALANDGITPLNNYDQTTGLLEVGAVAVGHENYAIIRLAALALTAGDISAEIFSSQIQDIDSTPNNGFDNGEDDTDTVVPTITNDINPDICLLPELHARGDAFVTTDNEIIVTPEQPNQAGFIWSHDVVDLNQALYAEVAVYLGDRDCNDNCTGMATEAGGEGLTFVLSADPEGVHAGDGGGPGLGVIGVAPSLVIEFDSFDDSMMGVDVDFINNQHFIDHTAIYLDGNVIMPQPMDVVIPAQAVLNNELEDGRYHIAQLEWQPQTNTLRYSLDGQLVGEVNRNIRNNLAGNWVRFGFTGSTGIAFNLQKACITVAPHVTQSDYGDAPDTTTNTGRLDYQTTMLNDGARHIGYDSNNNGRVDLQLGETWDADLGTLQSVNALADDNDNLTDEDGVTLPASLSTALPFSVVVEVQEDNGRTDNGIHLYAWADWNSDGVWADDERIINDTAVTVGTNRYDNIVVPAGTPAGQIYIRVRLCADNSCQFATGMAIGGEVEDYRIDLINQILISGQLFNDNGLGNVFLAHNGQMDAEEQAIGDYRVVLRVNEPINGLNAGDIIGTTHTNGRGFYYFGVDPIFEGIELTLAAPDAANWLAISEANVAHFVNVTNLNASDALMQMRLVGGNNLTGLDFGKVLQPLFETDHVTEVAPGTVVTFSHKFTVMTSGQVFFDIAVNSEQTTDWNVRLYQDFNCNGIKENNDTPLVTMDMDVNGVNEVCVIAQSSVPTSAHINATYNYDINAIFTYADVSSTQHGLVTRLVDSDSIRATFTGAGQLSLRKVVRNITDSGIETTSNLAKPGDVLEYKIYFENTGSGTIREVIIFDSVPPFSQLDNSVVCGSDLPSGQSCQIESPSATDNVSGYQGEIRWRLDLPLQSGESGSLSYQVLIE